MNQVGDKIIFTWLKPDSKCNETGLLTHRGMIVKDNGDNTFNVLYFDDDRLNRMNIAKNIDRNSIRPLSEIGNELDIINKTYDNLIEEQKKNLKTVSQEEKDKEKAARFESVKQRIIRNCECLLHNDIDEEDFVNRVGEISNLKKQMFSPEKLSCMSDIHRHNGTIKYNIRELDMERKKILERLNGDAIREKWNQL